MMPTMPRGFTHEQRAFLLGMRQTLQEVLLRTHRGVLSHQDLANFKLRFEMIADLNFDLANENEPHETFTYLGNALASLAHCDVSMLTTRPDLQVVAVDRLARMMNYITLQLRFEGRVTDHIAVLQFPDIEMVH